MPNKIKICGFQDSETLIASLNLGVDFVGLNNIKSSKRFLEQEQILNLLSILDAKQKAQVVVLIDVFELDFLNKLLEQGVKLIQDYSNSAEELIELGFTLIQVVSVSSKEDLNFKATNAEYILLDTKSNKHLGGSGESFDWSFLADYKASKQTILAGGINLENLLKALEYTDFIDIASGAEKDGVKSLPLIEKLVKAIN